MTGIYRGTYWYNRAWALSIYIVLRPIAVSLICAVLTRSVLAQGEPDQRAPAATVRTVGFDYSYSNFQGDIDAWHFAVLSIGERRPGGSLIGRVNLARRFASNGAQFEVDAYPSLGKGTYAYVNAGYSPSTIFPEWRSGAEIFRNLPHALEASLGYRQLRFRGPPVTLFTGSMGRYSGNYWYSLRPFLREKPTGLSASAGLTVRRFYSDADNYVGGRVSYGVLPSDDVVQSQLSRLSSMSIGLQSSKSLSSRTLSTWILSYEREEISVNNIRNRWEIGGGIKVRY